MNELRPSFSFGFPSLGAATEECRALKDPTGFCHRLSALSLSSLVYSDLLVSDRCFAGEVTAPKVSLEDAWTLLVI